MLPILNLNKHPKDCENLSLTDALNVRLSNDGSCLQSENAIYSNKIIENYISNYYGERYDIIKLIPCNTELIIITISNSNKNNPDKNIADIFRYNEELKQIKLVYKDFEYYKGKINGTFTYNVNNELIVAISEYDGNEDVPLKSINFGKFEEDREQIDNKLLSINPEVLIPTISYEYVPGNLPKGWYYLFIRYKIDNNDYTNWFPISDKILISSLEKQSIIKYYGRVDDEENNTTTKTFVSGCYDYFNTNDNLSNLNIKINLIDLDDKYKNYQIGFINTSKDNNICYITNDIKISISEYIISISDLYQHDINDLLINSYLPFNVNNIINYQNRLYISNYKEKLLKEYDTSKIKINLKNKILHLYDLKRLVYNKIDGINDYLETELDNTGEIKNLGVFNPIIQKDLELDGVKLNKDIFSNIDLNNKENEYEIEFYTSDIIDTQVGDALMLHRTFSIVSDLGFIKHIEFHAYFKVGYSNDSWFKDFNIYFQYNDEKGFIHRTKCSWYKPNYKQGTYSFKFKLGNNTITSEILNKYNDITEVFNYSNYINSKESFIPRLYNTTLIPGEIYNFFIHFVDKYGQVTKGFRIENNNTENIAKIPLDGLIIKDEDSDNVFYYDNYYLLKDVTENVFNERGYINITDEECILIEDISGLKSCMSAKYNNNVKEFISNKYKGLEKINNFTWGNLPDAISGKSMSLFINSNGDKLFKVPYSTIDVGTQIDSTLCYKAILNSIELENVKLPEDYVGYFISYEKPEYFSKITGVLTKYDLNEEYENKDFQSYNQSNGKYMRFYSSDFDINDSVELKYNAIRIEKKNCFKESNNFNRLENASLDYIANLNIPESEQEYDFDVKYYFIKDYSIEIANDYIKDRSNLGTVLKIPIIEDLFPSGEINMYKATLMYIDKNIYTNSDKKLIKCSNIIYENTQHKFTFDGYVSYNNFLIYNQNAFEFNSSDKIVYTENKKTYYDNIDSIANTAKFAFYAQMPVYKDYLYETKEFNNKPENIIYPLEITDDKENISDYKVKNGNIVIPQNSIDLFKNKYNNPNELIQKYYQNNRTDITYINEFTKFVRRSDIIKDESLSNSWRRFGLENYKVISENKGDITNLVGIGTYLIVHTEHSMFLFNNDNVLKTQDKNVQLEMPDIFTMDYKELVTSKLGYCGLQDSDAYVLGEFGYIFYDNDAHRLYKFDNGQIDVIDDDIVQFLYKYKPSIVRFAHDQYASRILLNIEYTYLQYAHNKTLSYNYKINKFISFHEYIFHDAVNTKNKLYLTRIGLPKIYNINYSAEIQNYSYNQFENGNGELRPSKLDIIVNDSYNIIKQLEYIIYKLYKVKVSTSDYNNYPVEEYRVPYSGEQIRVFNNEVDTGWLDIKIDREEAKNIFSNYEKPYWDLGNWNFSYLRNKLSEKLGSDFMSKLYGNYFIVSIIFGDSNERIEFESLGYNITKDRRI